MQKQTISNLERFIRLASKAGPSIAGSGGSDARFNVIQAGAVGLNLSDADTLRGLEESGWNASSNPPWSIAELTAAIPRIRRDSRRAPGYLLADDDRWKHRPTSTASKAPASPSKAPAARTGYDAATIAERAAVQVSWRKLRPLTGVERGRLAYLRNLPLASVDIACQNGRVMMDDSRPDCYVLTDGRGGFRQYRRWDGQPFMNGGKSRNLKGSLAKGFLTLGNRKLEPDDLVFIVEGAIGLLELVALQWLCAPHARRWYMVAAHSAASTFAADPELLAAIAGHHVRLLPDHGKQGKEAGDAWERELKEAGCRVIPAELQEPYDDLEILLAAGTAGLPAMRGLLIYPSATKGGIQC